MYKSTAIIASLVLLGSAHSASANDYMFGGGYWDWDISGQIRTGSPPLSTDADIKDDLNLNDDSTGYLFAVVEHPLPVLPNIRVATTNIESSGSGQASFTWNGTNFSNDVESTLELDQTDVTLYYQLLDNVVGLDLGLTARSADGLIRVVDTTNNNTEEAEFDGVIPMLYAGVQVELPLTGLTLGAAANALSVDDSSITDFNAYVRYQTSYMFGVEGGIRTYTLELEDLDDTTGEIEFDGAYVNLYLGF